MESHTVEFTLRKFSHDPYPFYRAWRQANPLLWNEAVDAWLVTGYRDVDSLIANPGLSSDLRAQFLDRTPSRIDRCPVIRRTLANWILYLDPPKHTRLRKGVMPTLSRASVATLEVAIEAAVSRLLDQLSQSGPEVDLIPQFAEPHAAQTLFAFLQNESPPRDCPEWAHRFARFIGCLRQSTRAVREAEQTLLEIEAHFRPLLLEPSSQFLELLCANPQLSAAEALAACSQLLLAGQDTTAGLLGNGLLALLQNPRARSQLLENPELMASAVEELLRFDCPSQLTSRIATEDIEMDDQVIHRGQTVNLFLGAANRDPERFERPDELWLDRPDNRHLAFGRGIHFCVGASLARLQARIGLGQLLARFPDIQLAQRRFPREQNWVVRNLRSLRVRLW